MAHQRHAGWWWTVTHGWTISAAFTMATLLIGAALAGVPVAAGGSWRDPQVRDQAWAFMALGAAGLAILVTATAMYRGRNRILHGNGTAYLIKERADGWSSDEARDFLIAARHRFARIIQVPGPARLAGPWDWPLGAGAQDWDQKLTELARSFQALHLDDEAQSPNGIFMWAWWAVAFAFAARVSAADRELVLDVWQRPSMGRAGRLGAIPWQQGAHRFATDGPPGRAAAPAPGCTTQQFIWPANVTVTSRARGPDKAAGHHPVSVLLLRLGYQSWGPLPETAGGAGGPHRVHLHLDDAAGLGLPARFQCRIHELRSLPPQGQSRFAWPVFPSLVGEAAQWIRYKAAHFDGYTLLVGAVVPPEIALGLGVTAARTDWPGALWPIVWQSGSGAMVIPRLNLGSGPLSPGAKGLLRQLPSGPQARHRRACFANTAQSGCPGTLSHRLCPGRHTAPGSATSESLLPAMRFAVRPRMLEPVTSLPSAAGQAHRGEEPLWLGRAAARRWRSSARASWARR